MRTIIPPTIGINGKGGFFIGGVEGMDGVNGGEGCASGTAVSAFACGSLTTTDGMLGSMSIGLIIIFERIFYFSKKRRAFY